MAVRTAKDIETLHEQMSEQFAQYLEGRQTGESAAALHEDPQLLLNEARASLEAAIRDRDEGLRMADLRIERRKNDLASLENNLKLATPREDPVRAHRKRKAKNRRNR